MKRTLVLTLGLVIMGFVGAQPSHQVSGQAVDGRLCSMVPV